MDDRAGGVRPGASGAASRSGPPRPGPSPEGPSRIPACHDIPSPTVASAAIASQDVAELVARLRRAMRRAARVALPTMPLSVAQLELLSVVAEHPGSRSGDLAELLRLAPNSVSTLANAMVGAGMLAREPGERDRRTVEYTLTPQGGGMVAAWQDTNAALLAAAVAGLSPARQRTLAAALPVLAELVERVDEQSDQAVTGEPGDR